MVYSQIVSQSSSRSSKEFPLQQQNQQKRQTLSKCPWSLGDRISLGPKFAGTKNVWNVPQNRWKGNLGYLDTFKRFVRDSSEEFSVTWGAHLYAVFVLNYYVNFQLMSTTWKQTRVKCNSSISSCANIRSYGCVFSWRSPWGGFMLFHSCCHTFKARPTTQNRSWWLHVFLTTFEPKMPEKGVCHTVAAITWISTSYASWLSCPLVFCNLV